MKVTPGSQNVTTYFVLRLTATGVEATGLTMTNFDLQYVRSGAAPSVKADATALAAVDSAHTDNAAFEVDATDQPGLYRVDWPDDAFVAGVREVILSVKCATVFTEHLRVELETVQTNDLSAADVNAELVDVLANDTHAELGQGNPSATASYGTMLRFLYKWFRNPSANDGTQNLYYNDAGTVVDQKQTTAVAGPLTSRGKVVTGP